MQVSLNLKPCEVPDGLATFEELISFIERERVPAGHVITRIVIDGSELDEEGERQAYSKPCSGMGIIEFHYARTVDLAKEGLTDATQLLPSLAEDLPEVSAELRSENLTNGLEMFGKCVEIISWYVSLVTAVDIIFRENDPAFRLNPSSAKSAEDLSPETDLTGLTIQDGAELSTFASVENLRQKLLDVEQAQANNDTLLLADLIEYEILPIVNIWIAEAPVLLAKVSREGGTA